MTHPYETIVYTNGLQELCLNFGIGRLLVNYGYDQEKKTPCVYFEVLKEEAQVGDNSFIKMSKEELEQKIDHSLPIIRMNFANEASLDVLQGAIDLVREKLQEQSHE